jgi:short-subunit dehydrogenase
MQRVAVFGATSAIAQQLIRIYAGEGARLVLVARNGERLRAVEGDARARGAAEVTPLTADLNETDEHRALVRRAWELWDGLDVAVIAQGVLGDQKHDQTDAAATELILKTNFTAPAALLTLLGVEFERARAGTMVVISSVAGDRGRPTNYIYGASKAGLDAFLSGLRARLYKAGVAVVTVKPGFVDTPMTAHLKKNPLFASPAAVAKGIRKAIAGGADVVYLPGFWRWILLIIRLLPEWLFKRLTL